MQRILLIGSPGAGKTTLGKQLSQQLDLPLVHLDQIFWRGNWQQAPKEEFDHALQKELEKPRWIIDGNYIRTLAHRLSYCDTVIWLDFSTPICLWGVIKRLFQNLGKARDDMGGECVEKLDRERLEFFRYVATFNKKYRGVMGEQLNKSGVTVIHLKKRWQMKRMLADLDQI